MVQWVGKKVPLAVQRLYPDAVQVYKCKFVLIKDKVNAWAFPGGKYAVYTVHKNQQ